MSPIVRTLAAGAALFAMAAAGVAVAQNYSLNPTYGTLNLAAGFRPDPQVVNLQSGGSVNAQTLSSSCMGFIADAPDVRVNYTAGQYQLMISADAAADTTLVVNGPDGSWYCDDDGGNQGLNPSITFNSKQSGRYEIWVGTYGNSSMQPAELHISELYSQ